jgi:hypothetical protein
MNINGNVELMDYSSIYDYMAIVDKNDNLIINLNQEENEHIDMFCKMLEDNNFIVSCDKHYDHGRYHISAIKY